MAARRSDCNSLASNCFHDRGPASKDCRPSNRSLGAFGNPLCGALGIRSRPERSDRKVVDSPHIIPADPIALVPVRCFRSELARAPVSFVLGNADREGDTVGIHHAKIPGPRFIAQAVRHGKFGFGLGPTLYPGATSRAYQVGNAHALALHVLPQLRVSRTALKLGDLMAAAIEVTRDGTGSDHPYRNLPEKTRITSRSSPSIRDQAAGGCEYQLPVESRGNRERDMREWLISGWSRKDRS